MGTSLTMTVNRQVQPCSRIHSSDKIGNADLEIKKIMGKARQVQMLSKHQWPSQFGHELLFSC